MGQSAKETIANDMVDGYCCSHCCIYFENPHGYPVLCHDCYEDEPPQGRADIQRATELEIRLAKNK
jgi:hypothetical protein